MACKLGLCEEETVRKIKSAVDAFGLPVDIPWSADELVEAMKSDKKNRDAQIVFELPYSLGECIERKLDKAKTVEVINDIWENKTK